MTKRFLIILSVLAGIWLASPVSVQAAAPAPLTQVGACAGGLDSFLGLQPWDACLDHNAGVPQLGKLTDVWLIVLVLLDDGIKAAGYVSVGFVTWGGIKYLKSQGDPGQLTEARQIIYNALFGLLLTLISVAIVNFVAGAFSS
jgi:hypothetical protein